MEQTTPEALTQVSQKAKTASQNKLVAKIKAKPQGAGQEKHSRQPHETQNKIDQTKEVD
jgi:hypothetical protein